MQHSSKRFMGCSILGFTIAVLSGCERNNGLGQVREEEQAVAPATTAAPAISSAIQSITDARCAREERCQNVGSGREYASRATCQTRIADEWRDELNTFECPGGVVEKELNECLAEIRNENCESPFDTLGRIAACRSSDICKAVDTR